VPDGHFGITEMNRKNNGKTDGTGGALIFAATIVAAILLAASAYRIFNRYAGRIAGGFFHPYNSLAKRAANVISEKTLLAMSHMELATECDALIRENRSLLMQRNLASSLAAENARLRQMLNLPEQSGWHWHTGEIIMRDPYLWNGRMTVKLLPEIVVSEGDAAAAVDEHGGLCFVGVVEKINGKYCDVITLFNPEFRCSFRTGTDGSVGFVNANGRHSAPWLLPIGNMSITGKYEIGDDIYTTGFEHRLPADPRLGSIKPLDDVLPLYTNNLQCGGEVVPAFNPDHLQFLLIISRDRSDDL
ncbi:MAG: rod shape-determining protein MreC, partial [Victivallaceae bacterium]|nr:rod shape-determining protein MreC [Victivallaceae bacterium]